MNLSKSFIKSLTKAGRAALSKGRKSFIYQGKRVNLNKFIAAKRAQQKFNRSIYYAKRKTLGVSGIPQLQTKRISAFLGTNIKTLEKQIATRTRLLDRLVDLKTAEIIKKKALQLQYKEKIYNIRDVEFEASNIKISRGQGKRAFKSKTRKQLVANFQKLNIFST